MSNSVFGGVSTFARIAADVKLPAAIAAAQAQYTATAHGYEILSGQDEQGQKNQAKATAMHQKAAEVGRMPPPAPTAPVVEDPNMK